MFKLGVPRRPRRIDVVSQLLVNGAWRYPSVGEVARHSTLNHADLSIFQPCSLVTLNHGSQNWWNARKVSKLMVVSNQVQTCEIFTFFIFSI
jgi:hypothetical protein